jgi:hypothetical protein
MITESGMPAYRESRTRPLHDYDLFLNQRARRFPVRPWRASHEIDLPWAFQTRDCYGWNPRSEDGSVGLDSHTWKLVEEGLLNLPKLNPGIPIRGRPIEFLGQYAQSRYFLRMGPRKTWGTSLLEASCAGCLVLGDPQSVVHSAPLLPALQVKNSSECLRRLAWLEDHPNERAELWRRQQAKTRDLAFLRPLRHLVEAVEGIRNARVR